MAVAKAPLPFVSFSGEDPKFIVTESDFETLERAYDLEIPPAARDRLIQIGNSYLFSRRSEINRQTWRDVAGFVPVFREAARALWAIAYEHPTRNDAGSEFETIFAEILRRDPLIIQPERGELVRLAPGSDRGWTDVDEQYQLPDGAYGIRLGPNFLDRLAMSFTVAVNRTEREIEIRASEPLSRRPLQNAISALIVSLTEWASTFNLPIAPYVSGETPGQFARFASAFIGLVPKEFREARFRSAGALAAQTRRARKADKEYKREQEQRRLAKQFAPLESEPKL